MGDVNPGVDAAWDEVRAAKDEHMQHLFNRLLEEVPIDADEYLQRLTEDIE